MLRQLHHRCWVVGVPIRGAEVTHHHSEMAASGAVVDHLLQASLQVAIGQRAPDAMPVEDLWQLPRPCWTMRCSGCRRLFSGAGQRHWPSPDAARRAADGQEWAGDLELCPACVALVIPLRRRRIGSPVEAPAAG